MNRTARIRIISLAAGIWLLAAPAVYATPVTSGLIYWLDGTDTNADGSADGWGAGTPLSAWVNKSGGHVATQGNAAYQPSIGGLGGSQVVLFGGNDFLDVTGPTGFQTSLFVYQDVSTKSWVTPLGTTGGFGGGAFHGNNNDASIFNATWTHAQTRDGIHYRGGGAPVNWTTTPRPDAWTIDAHIGTSPITDHSVSDVGGDDYDTPNRSIQGGIAEILLYNRALGTGELDQVGSYLAAKYGLTWNPVLRGPITFDSVASGNWSDPAIWSPSGDAPPIAGDTATVSGDNVVLDAGATGQIEKAVVSAGGVLDLNGRTLTAARLELTGGSAALARTGGGSFNTGTLWLSNGSTFTFAPADTAADVTVTYRSTIHVTTSDSGNLTNSFFSNLGSLNLGADLNIAGALSFGQTAGDGVAFNTNGYNATFAGGRWWNASTLNRAGTETLTVNGHWNSIGAATIDLCPGDYVQILEGSQYNANFVYGRFELTQSAGDTTGLTIGSDLALLVGNNINNAARLTLNFDSDLQDGLDWGLKWSGNHVGALEAYRDKGQLVWNVPAVAESITGIWYDGPTNATYVGYDASFRIWDDAVGDWSTATNWDPDLLPVANSVAIVDNGGTANVTAPGLAARVLNVDNGGVRLAAGGGLTVGQEVNVAPGATLDVQGVLNAPLVNTSGTTTIAGAVGGTVNVNAGTTAMTGGSATTLNASAGTVDVQAFSAVTNLNVDGGTVRMAGGDLVVTNAEIKSGAVGTSGGNALVVADGGQAKLDKTTFAVSGGTAGLRGADLLSPTAAAHNTLSLRGGAVTVTPPAAPPDPTNLAHRWTFDDGTMNDSIGTAHGHAENASVRVADGRLLIDNAGRMYTDPIGSPIGQRTLMVWTSLLDPAFQSRGSALTIENNLGGSQFDAIVYAERQNRRWMPGSDYFNRTQDPSGGGAIDETVGEPGEVMIAIVYRPDNSIQVFRDGVPYGDSYAKGTLVTYDANAVVQIGRRHGTHADTYRGYINEARIYDAALTAAQILDVCDSFGAPGALDMAYWDVEVTASTRLALNTPETATFGDLVVEMAAFTPGDTILELQSQASSIGFGDLYVNGRAPDGVYTLLDWSDWMPASAPFHDGMFGSVHMDPLWALAYTDSRVSLTVTSGIIPEPATGVLAVMAFVGLGGYVRLRRGKSGRRRRA